ncbi:YjzC family protein [Streptomyces sp. NPDC060333]|uniref:YjzC family protein n=1 Tax=Streptomyces sp. NPDC060333 TaxID=3347098 RepID=UPI0036589A56
MSNKAKPGTPAPKSGQYKSTGSKTEVTAVKGKPLPPTPKPGQTWTLVDPTKHKNK